MSTKSTVWDAVASAIVSTLRGTSGFRDPATAGTGIPVFDGPEVGDPEQKAVVVGAPYGEGSAGTTDRRFAALGSGAAVEESGSVTCYAIAASGDATFSAVRSSVVSVLNALSAALPSGAALGVAEVLGIELDTGRVEQFVTSNGVAAVIEFTVTYEARLT